LFHWTPEQVHALDPAYVEELQARIKAENFNARTKAE